PGKDLLSDASRTTDFVAMADGKLFAARLVSSDLEPGVVPTKRVLALAKKLDRLELGRDSLFGGYWDLVETNGLAIAEQAGHFEDPLGIPASVEVRGSPSNLRISGEADVEKHVTFDTRLGPIIVERGASVESFSRVMGPCFLGPRVKLLSALVGGGTSIFEASKVGGQVENSIILPHTNKAHHGYVGDSYVGEWVNLGAGATFSNLKNTYGNVRLQVGRRKLDSGMIKLGPAVGDMCKVSIGSLVHAGRLLGTGSHVAGAVKSNVPSFTYSDGDSGRMVQLLLESVLETQRRMMERRGLTLTRAEEELIRGLYRVTSGERKKSGVRKGSLS
ncbi:MAG: hypothetical protein HY297_03380, partial [Thaumarchaeota archaeon]|nr:hypothetical protein [Nitrososphaerota archaeon]